MNFFSKESEDVKVIQPPVLGWLEKKLSKKEMDYLWRCINNRSKKSHKSYLAGAITESNLLDDKSDWFWLNTVKPLCEKYGEKFNNIGKGTPVNQRHPYYLHEWWVNYQRENEFNPSHTHTGVYSFVIWMKIPTRHDEQNKNPISSNSNTQAISTFQFLYTNIISQMESYFINMDPEMEGTMLFFPSQLAHQVHPFYNCDEERISISGNIFVNTAKLL